MPKLRCDAKNCKHNLNCYCTRNKIEVGEINNYDLNALCKDYKTGESVIKNEFAKDIFMDSPYARSVKIDCYAKDCKYNIDEVCCTHEVSIENSNQCYNCAYCATYKERT